MRDKMIHPLGLNKPLSELLDLDFRKPAGGTLLSLRGSLCSGEGASPASQAFLEIPDLMSEGRGGSVYLKAPLGKFLRLSVFQKMKMIYKDS